MCLSDCLVFSKGGLHCICNETLTVRERGKWLKSIQCKVWTHRHSELYRTGFHIMARCYKYLANDVVIKVKFRNGHPAA